MNYKSYQDNYNKHVFTQSLPQMISENECDYEAYFMTVTFQNRRSVVTRADYIHFFSNFYCQLNQATVNNPSKNSLLKAMLIGVPEKSISNKYSIIPHYHCILMIDKKVHEKFERQERQLARYGRTFREGIHSQIREMKEKLETLYSREVEHKKYRTFVTMIETEVMKIKVAPKNDIPTPPAKPVLSSQAVQIVKSSGEPSAASLSKGQVIMPTKAKIPDEYKQSPRTEKLQLLFEKANKLPSSMPKAGVERAVHTTTAPPMAADKGVTTQGRVLQTNDISKANVISKSSNPQSYKIEANE